MKKYSYSLLFFLLINSISNSFSQGLNGLSDYEFENYAVAEGTAMSGSLVVFQDKLGYIWLGSQSGIDRFDGYNFKNFALIKSDSSSTNLRWVNAIAEDSKGNIWATDQFGYISNYKRFEEKWVNYSPNYKDSIKNVPEGSDTFFYPQPSSIIISKEDRYAYVGVFGLGLIRIDSETGEHKIYEENLNYEVWYKYDAAHKMINEIEWLDDKNILVATGNGFRVFDTEKEEYTRNFLYGENNDPANDWPEGRIWVRYFEIIDENNLWASTGNKGLLKVNIEDETYESYTDKTNVSGGNDHIFYDKEKEQLWINVENVGIEILDIKSMEVIKLTQYNSSLRGNVFNNIIKDNQENIWISSVTNGMLKYDPGKKKFKPFLKDSPKNMELGSAVIWGLTFDNKNNLWLGSLDPGGGIINLDFKKQRSKVYSKRNNTNEYFYSLFTDNIGSIWAFQNDLVMVKREDDDEFKIIGDWNDIRKDESELSRLFDPFITYNGNVIFPGRKPIWLVDKDGNGKFEEYNIISENIKEPITGFQRIDSTHSYIISDRSIFLWDEKSNDIVDLIPNEKDKLKEHLDSYQAPGVLHDGILYFGTYGNGILFVNLVNEDIGFITSNDGLPNMYLYNMYKDNNDNFWMASNQGIIKYNPYTKLFRQYTPVDGVQNYEFNANSSDVSDEGFIAMGGLSGINYFDPTNINENLSPPRVIIQNVNIGGTAYKIDAVSNDSYDEIKFKDNSLSFEYVAFNFRNTEQNKYKYKMVGYDQEWIEAVDRRFVSYTNLPIGSYTFNVQGSNNDGVWNEDGASYSFIILPPWYRTWYAYVSYVLLLAFGFRSFGKYQAKKSLEQADNERRAGELEEAKKIQESMLPKVFPSSKQFDVSAGLVTSTEIGGDYYDFFENKNSLYAVCGDATGHGTASGMMVSIIKSGLNGLPALSTNKVLYELNNIVKKIDLGTLKMSLNICEVKKDSMTLSSAAMPPMYLYNSNSKKTEEILIRGLPLGGLKNETFDIEKRKFNKDDVLVLLSDGLPEAENDAGELYDYERVIDIITKNATKTAEELKSKLIGEVDIWLKGRIPDDDVTIVVIKKN